MGKFVGGIACFLTSFALVGLLILLVNTQFFGAITAAVQGGGPDPFLVGVVMVIILAAAAVAGVGGNKLIKQAEREALDREAVTSIMLGDPPELGTEMEHGRQRLLHERAQAASRFFATGELPTRFRAEGFSAEDAAWLVMFYQQGATFNGGVTLPSGRFLTGEEVYKVIGPPAS